MKSTDNTKMEIMALPQPYGKAPIFAPKIQEKKRIVRIEEDVYWEIGVEDPLDKDISNKYSRGFDIRHAQVIFGLILYYHLKQEKYGTEINISYNKLLQICGFVHGKKQDNMIKEILADLENTSTAIIEKGKSRDVFKVIGEVSIHEDYTTHKTKIRYLVFSKGFIKMLNDYKQYFSFHMDFWLAMPSKIAQAIYLYLPARALACQSFDDSARINLSNLLQQLEMKVPTHKSLRKKIFEQGKVSILEQLDNAPLHNDKVLRVRLEETKDKTDYNLCAWIEEKDSFYIPVNLTSNLATRWRCAGGNLMDYQERLRNKLSLNPYEKDCLSNVGINVEKDKNFLQMVKTLLQADNFSKMVGSINMLNQDKGRTIENPYAYLLASIDNEFKKLPKQQCFEFK